MGLNFSVLNIFGVSGTSAATTKQVYEWYFADKDTATFEDFHIAYVEFCKYFNRVMCDQDFDTPSTIEILIFFDTVWKLEKNDDVRKQRFLEFLRKGVREAAKVDNSFSIAAGLAVPVAAVVGKGASGYIPYVKRLRLDLVPNVVFVPFVTLLGIVRATAWQVAMKIALDKVEDEANKEAKKLYEKNKEVLMEAKKAYEEAKARERTAEMKAYEEEEKKAYEEAKARKRAAETKKAPKLVVWCSG